MKNLKAERIAWTLSILAFAGLLGITIPIAIVSSPASMAKRHTTDMKKKRAWLQTRIRICEAEIKSRKKPGNCTNTERRRLNFYKSTLQRINTLIQKQEQRSRK